MMKPVLSVEDPGHSGLFGLFWMGPCWITALWSLTKAPVIYQLSEISACHAALDDRDPRSILGLCVSHVEESIPVTSV